MVMVEGELNLGKSGFMITPIERGQRLYTQRARHADCIFEVQGIEDTRVILRRLDNNQSFPTNLERLARHGKAGKYTVVDILPH